MKQTEQKRRRIPYIMRRFLFICAVFCILKAPALAITPIPENSGLGGFISVGGAYISAETNMIKGTNIFEVGNETVDSIFDSPDSESDFVPVLSAEIAYTFADSRTQVYLGNQLEDLLRFDFETLFGVRQELPDGSIGAVSFVFQPLVTEVWEDPYVADVARRETDRDGSGIRLEWDRPMGTNLGLLYQYRSIDIDDERSGTLGGLGLTPAQIALLDREGDTHRMDLYYNWKLGGGQALVPQFRYYRWDLDGEAMAHDGYTFMMTYAYRGDKYSFTATGAVGTEDYDERNPIYGRTRDDDIYGLGVNIFRHRPFGLPKGYSLVATLAWYEGDSNINFYDSQVNYAGVSLLYRF